MTLQQLMASDLQSTFLNTGELAVIGTYTPKGGTPFAINAMPGDIADVELIRDGTVLDQQRCPFLFSLTQLKAGIIAAYPAGRGLPNKGDLYQVTQQGSVGGWLLETHAEDLGDGCVCWMRYEAKLSTGGVGATRP